MFVFVSYLVQLLLLTLRQIMIDQSPCWLYGQVVAGLCWFLLCMYGIAMVGIAVTIVTWVRLLFSVPPVSVYLYCDC